MMHAIRIICIKYLVALALGAVTQNEDTSAEREDVIDWIPHEAGLNFTELANKYGYTVEQYEVITEDGYILILFHIFGGFSLPVLLLHGILDSSETWLVRGNDSLGINLVELGYDVWFGNSRGNRYSRRHIVYDPDKDPIFWRFSFDQVGYFDVPAIIDKILSVTGAPSVSAIVHSQGNTAFYVLGATRPEYNTRVNVAISLAPVCYLHHSPAPISNLIKLRPIIEQFVSKYNIDEVLGDNSTLNEILREVCPIPVIGYTACILGLLFPFTGYDPNELEPEFAQTIPFHFPAGTSAQSLIHYLQVGDRKIFAPYDYGISENLIVYNSTVPPPYALSNVTMPVALLAAKNDYLSTLPDVALLRRQLANVVYYIVNPRALFNHADDVWGRRMRSYLFPYIFRLLRRYNVRS